VAVSVTGGGNRRKLPTYRKSLKPEYPVKTTDKLYHIKLYQVHLVMSRIQTQNFSGQCFHYKF